MCNFVVIRPEFLCQACCLQHLDARKWPVLAAYSSSGIGPWISGVKLEVGRRPAPQKAHVNISSYPNPEQTFFWPKLNC